MKVKMALTPSFLSLREKKKKKKCCVETSVSCSSELLFTEWVLQSCPPPCPECRYTYAYTRAHIQTHTYTHTHAHIFQYFADLFRERQPRQLYERLE